MEKSTQLNWRLPVFFAGLLFNGFGVALSARAGLGTSPLAAAPYVLSLLCPLTLGQLMTALNLLFIAGEILLLRKAGLTQLLQLAVAAVYGQFTDWAGLLLAWVSPQSYSARWAVCLLSIFLIGFGVYLLVEANLVVLPSEGLSLAVSSVTHWEFSRVKIALDCSMALSGAALSLGFLHELAGAREGTLAAAVGVGLIVRLFHRRIAPALASLRAGNRGFAGVVRSDA